MGREGTNTQFIARSMPKITDEREPWGKHRVGQRGGASDEQWEKPGLVPVRD